MLRCNKREDPFTMGLVSFTKVILPAFAGSCVVSYAFWDLSRNRKVFGGNVLLGFLFLLHFLSVKVVAY